MTDWNRVEGLLGQEGLRWLAEKRVAIVGLGSGGGYVAQALAMTGIQHFVLVDDDVLDSANIVRHVADARYIGRSKVGTMRDLIHERNATAMIEAYVGRIEDHLEVLDHADVLIVGVDGEATKFMLNEACLERNLIAVYAGVYERGEGGDVVVIDPQNGPCYACWAENLREGFAPNEVDHRELDYGQVRPDGTLQAEPGLWLDVVRVANTQANIALNVLLAGTKNERALPANTVILANQAIEIISGQMTPPFSAEWVDIKRNPACLVCGQYHHDARRATAELSLDSIMDLANQDDVQDQEEWGFEHHD